MHAIEAREQRNAFAGALGIHLLLIGSVLVSFHWSTKSPLTVQAELWSSLPPLTANPIAPDRAPVPKIAPNVAPKVAPKETLKPDPAKVAPPAAANADIALEKKKEIARLEAQRQDEKRQEAKRLAQEKALADQRLREEEAAKALAAQKLKEKEAADRLAERLAEQRKAELARLGIDPNAKSVAPGKSAASKAGVTDGAEIGARTGESAQYADMIRSHVRSRIQFDPQRLPGNPEVIFIVEQLPTGQITSVTKRKSSGSIAWDNAVERAIRASDPLPKKKDGTVERVLDLRFRPKEER